MEEKSAFDILTDNLKELGYEPQANVNNRMFIIPDDRISNKKFVAAELPNSIYFLATDSFTNKAQSSTTFTGLYTVIDLPEEAQCKIHPKDWVGSLLLMKKKKIGVKKIDDRVIITSSGWVPKNELDEKSVDLFLELNKKGFPYNLIIEDNYVYHIRDLRDKKILGIETNDWVYKTEDLENLLTLGLDLINHIKNRCNTLY